MYKSNVAFQNLRGIVTIDNRFHGGESDVKVFDNLLKDYHGYHRVGLIIDLGGVEDFSSCNVTVVISDGKENSNLKSFKAKVSIAEFIRLSKNFELTIGDENIDWSSIEEIEQVEEK